MITKLRRWFFNRLQSVENWRYRHDLCEICSLEPADAVCVGCGRHICRTNECESGYYQDEDLCTICRDDITPEEEAEDRKEQKELEAEDGPEPEPSK